MFDICHAKVATSETRIAPRAVMLVRSSHALCVYVLLGRSLESGVGGLETVKLQSEF